MLTYVLKLKVAVQLCGTGIWISQVRIPGTWYSYPSIYSIYIYIYNILLLVVHYFRLDLNYPGGLSTIFIYIYTTGYVPGTVILVSIPGQVSITVATVPRVAIDSYMYVPGMYV